MTCRPRARRSTSPRTRPRVEAPASPPRSQHLRSRPRSPRGVRGRPARLLRACDDRDPGNDEEGSTRVQRRRQLRTARHDCAARPPVAAARARPVVPRRRGSSRRGATTIVYNPLAQCIRSGRRRAACVLHRQRKPAPPRRPMAPPRRPAPHRRRLPTRASTVGEAQGPQGILALDRPRTQRRRSTAT